MLRVLPLVCTFAALAVAGPASAATFVVTKTPDTLDGSCTPADCSLREAITAANTDDDEENPNADGLADIVTVPAGTYPLTSGALDITASVTVTGAGARATIILGNGADRVIDVSGSKLTTEISGVTVTGGGGVSQGAGLFAGGTVSVHDAAFVGNATTLATTTTSRQGAGIFLNGTATIERVLIAGNTTASIAGDTWAPQGAGLFANGAATLVNVTVSGNTANGTLGGQYGPQGAGIFINGGPSSLANVTVAGNTAVDADAQGGGIFFNDATTVRHSIVAGNTGGAGTDECFVNDTVTSAAMNLSTNAADCSFTGPADVSGDPLLAALADNGGPSNTRAPAAGSPAVDRVPFTECAALDQRGFARAGAGTACDLGAHEVGAPVPTPIPTPSPTPTPPPAQALKPLKATSVFTLPSAKSCVSRRSFTIRIRRISGVTFVSATVFVNGKRARVVRGKRLTAPINLKGLPKGRFTVKITAVAKDGRKVTGSRRYMTCAPRSKTRRRAPKL